jgi:hypothetical protein
MRRRAKALANSGQEGEEPSVPERDLIYDALRRLVSDGTIADFRTNYDAKIEPEQLLVTVTLNPATKTNREEVRFRVARELEAAGAVGAAVAIAASVDYPLKISAARRT